MKIDSKALLTYWRACVSDSTLGNGRFRQTDLNSFESLTAENLSNGRLSQEQTERLFAGQPGNSHALSVRLWPQLFARQRSHGTARDDDLPEFLAPLVTDAQLTREGLLLPGRTVIARDLLEPLAAGSFSIGTINGLDLFLTETGFAPNDELGRWQDYLTYCGQLMQGVTDGWPGPEAPYIARRTGLLKAGEASAATRGILTLYDSLISDMPAAPLLHGYARMEPVPLSPVLSRPYDLADRLGHCNDRFPLAEHQRDVLAHLAQARHGDIIAVNGPPGTGKTTMLLSAIASAWVRAARDGSEPPIIVAVSANNQAVTNIIDAFGKDFATGEGPFAGRWLPGIKSFGLFLPAATREAEAAKQYQTEIFLQNIETEDYVLAARQEYLTKARAAFPGEAVETVEAAVVLLQARMKTEAARLTTMDAAWARLQETRAALAGGFGPDRLAAYEADIAKAKNDLRSASELGAAWDRHRAGESVFLALFGFLPPVAQKNLIRARVALTAAGYADFAAQIDSTESCGALIRHQLRQAQEVLYSAETKAARCRTLISSSEQAHMTWADAARSLAPADPDAGIESCDQIADCSIRFGLFLLATHYWEGRWLIEMDRILPGLEAERSKTGQKTVVPRWRRRMMLTPCAVATFATLPGKMKYRRKVDGNYRDEYLYDFIELLIVDEAGQVLPEIAAPSFALARTALVIGDRHQIEPISSQPRAIDIGNLAETGVLPAQAGDDQVQQVLDAGIASSSGSAMRVAQNACAFQPYPELDRGLHLFEHRRCYDEIISYCNALCYKGMLQPRRGKVPAESSLPPIGYLHVDGIGSKLGGSRANLLEARMIAAWLADNRAPLEARYGSKKLEQIVGIVTPFGCQVHEIREACAAKGIVIEGKEGMTVGTVHSLQGAERAVVIFSPVYSKHEDGGFIDNSRSILNVAVSRAQDSFLVFGDMDVFATAVPGSPRALLAKFLFASEDNGLAFVPEPRADLQPGEQVFTLRDAVEHDAFLHKALAGDAERYIIVSPWVIRPTMEETGLLEAFRTAVGRGAEIEVFTDPLLNETRGSGGINHFVAAETALTDIGVKLRQVRQLHSKIVAADESLLCIGSYNWLSADRHGKYARHETSFVYRGAQLQKEIRVIRDSLLQREIK